MPSSEAARCTLISPHQQSASLASGTRRSPAPSPCRNVQPKALAEDLKSTVNACYRHLQYLPLRSMQRSRNSGVHRLKGIGGSCACAYRWLPWHIERPNAGSASPLPLEGRYDSNTSVFERGSEPTNNIDFMKSTDHQKFLLKEYLRRGFGAAHLQQEHLGFPHSY